MMAKFSQQMAKLSKKKGKPTGDYIDMLPAL
jgi:hypothetical protein